MRMLRSTRFDETAVPADERSGMALRMFIITKPPPSNDYGYGVSLALSLEFSLW